jgi:hypothetical protein
MMWVVVDKKSGDELASASSNEPHRTKGTIVRSCKYKRMSDAVYLLARKRRCKKQVDEILYVFQSSNSILSCSLSSKPEDTGE